MSTEYRSANSHHVIIAICHFTALLTLYQSDYSDADIIHPNSNVAKAVENNTAQARRLAARRPTQFTQLGHCSM